MNTKQSYNLSESFLLFFFLQFLNSQNAKLAFESGVLFMNTRTLKASSMKCTTELDWVEIAGVLMMIEMMTNVVV